MSTEKDVRAMLRERAGGVAAAPVVPERTVRRTQMRKALSTGGALAVVAAIGVAGAFVARSAFSNDTAPIRPAGAPDAAETTTATAQDIEAISAFAPLETGTYYIDPDGDPSTPLRVVYEISADGWLQWIGGTKDSATKGHVGVSITTVTNIVSHGCRDHSPADPPVGPTVDDLAAALADLAPFRVTSPPSDVTMSGYLGKHLALTVPDLPTVGTGDSLQFAKCPGGNLQSWISPLVDAFFGHAGPGYTEEFWILNVEGTRLVLVGHRSADSPADDVAEMRAIIDSVRIEP